MDTPTGHPTRAEVLLDEADRLLLPLARLLIANGVGYPQLAARLKGVFLDAARCELAAQGGRQTDSALSLLSGVHRKDIRAAKAAEDGSFPRSGSALSFAAEVFTRWLHDPALRGADGNPLELPRNGPAPSFESLVAAMSTDVHARSVLDELLRLGVVRLAGEVVIPNRDGFIPREGFRELAFYFGENVRDHIAAAASNLRAVDRGAAPAFLEQSVFADGLSAKSTEALADVARQLWRNAFDGMVEEATRRCEEDTAAEADRRMRFGMYYYAEPTTPKEDES
ncbi:DUF6502 family protein [Niveibacterium sp. 24ML]|uniref:DUF6502 family protein n=1 Tax=Niveibacterium sp. 24ML TaxID=2985512 RepID=UPI00226F2FB0|nr:DUF6502 family protein [Niveibacterium sp. 24ML]MCX9155371.1 DUF6502 family protein [Niveibacterium sp. 24ML]